MRVLFVNDGVGDAGGVQRYLATVARELSARGHALALLHLDRLRAASDSPAGAEAEHFCIDERGIDGAVQAAAAWRPDVGFSHNMRVLAVDDALVARLPVVKMMHGYFGTCIGGQKMHAFPRAAVCNRRFGAACTMLYLPRHCGQWNLHAMSTQYAWAKTQRSLFARYSALMVASEHMRREYVRNGAPDDAVIANPLFADALPDEPAAVPTVFRVVFLARMTSLKGGDVLIRAVALANRQLDTPVDLVLAGDGPARPTWESLADALGVRVTFPGWVDERTRAELLQSASVVAVPSVWPEPFGLTGLEGGAYGAAAIAFNVGGIGDWLHEGENGWLVDPRTGARGMAQALVDAATHPATLRAMRAGARAAAERWSTARHVDVLETVLDRAVSRGGRHG